jgi:hypothetical protein
MLWHLSFAEIGLPDPWEADEAQSPQRALGRTDQPLLPALTSCQKEKMERRLAQWLWSDQKALPPLPLLVRNAFPGGLKCMKEG